MKHSGSTGGLFGKPSALLFRKNLAHEDPRFQLGLEFLGVAVDPNTNNNPLLDADISSSDSRVKVLVIRAAEDWAIAAAYWRLCLQPVAAALVVQIPHWRTIL